MFLNSFSKFDDCFQQIIEFATKNLKTLIAVLNFTKERKGGSGLQKCDGVTTFLIHYK
jgi:hypothetical protein